MRIHALIFFLFTQSALALTMYGGVKTAPNKHLVKLMVNREVFCQGVAITSTKVLTSGHCIQDMGLRLRENSSLLTYYPDVVSVIADTDRVQAKYITIAPTYFDSPGASAEDLALIELPRALKGVEILPVANPSDLRPGSDVLLTSRKQEVSTKILQRLRGLDGLIIKSDGSFSGICQGDSGGALVLVKNGKKYLAGVLAAQNTGCVRKHTLAYFPRTNF